MKGNMHFQEGLLLSQEKGEETPSVMPVDVGDKMPRLSLRSHVPAELAQEVNSDNHNVGSLLQGMKPSIWTGKTGWSQWILKD